MPWIILGSALLAHLLPFELIIFSYAFLGPAHYLTQISWLHDRSYFSTARWFAVLAIAWTLVVLTFKTQAAMYMWGALVLAVLASTFSMVIRVGLAVSLVGLFFLSSRESKAALLITSLLPTVIHVYLFTFLFMLSGYLKRKEKIELVNLILFGLASLSFFVIPHGSPVILDGWVATNGAIFRDITFNFAKLFNQHGAVRDAFLWIALMKFISFAYTHHYLNWFMKTELTAWHKLPRSRLVIICISYFIFVGIYAYDYKLGLTTLALLSLLHVVLELPLNIATVRGLVKGG